MIWNPTILRKFYTLRSSHHSVLSLLGIFVLFVFIIQILSGTMLSFSLNCDPMNIPMSRNEEDMEDLYADDFFWLHERGVDYSFIFIYFHIFRKIYISGHTNKQEGAWKSGAFLLLFLHVVTFFGLVLCCTHLSEVTLTIAANMLHSIVLKYGKIYWWVFPDQELNSDTIVRLMYGHYVAAFFLLLMSTVHSLEMHYDWKDTYFDESHKTNLAWFDDVLKSEILNFSKVCFFISVSCAAMYSLSEPSSTELFMWGDVGAATDIRFYGVTPHWYFRAFMAWLIVCPHHYLGLSGLVFFMIMFYYQPQLKQTDRNGISFVKSTDSILRVTLYLMFVLAILYGTSYLPYGKFYNRLGGNLATLFAFSYALIYLSIPLVWYNRKINKYFFKRTFRFY